MSKSYTGFPPLLAVFKTAPLPLGLLFQRWRKGGILKPYTGLPPLLAVFEAASLPLGLPFQNGGTGEIRTHTVLPLKQVTLPVGLQFRGEMASPLGFEPKLYG